MIWCQEMSALVGIVAPDGSISSSMDETMNMKPMKLRFALTTVRRPNEPPLEFIHLGLTSLEIRHVNTEIANRSSGASKKDRKEASKTKKKQCFPFHFRFKFPRCFPHFPPFLSPFPGAPWTGAWLISWTWIGTCWRGKSSKALSPWFFFFGFYDVWCRQLWKYGKWWGKLELCCGKMESNWDEHRLWQHPKWKEILIDLLQVARGRLCLQHHQIAS